MFNLCLHMRRQNHQPRQCWLGGAAKAGHHLIKCFGRVFGPAQSVEGDSLTEQRQGDLLAQHHIQGSPKVGNYLIEGFDRGFRPP